jgi:hypothetical protein
MKTNHQNTVGSTGLKNRSEQLSTGNEMNLKAYQTPDGWWTSEVDTGVMRSTQPGFASEQEALTDAESRAAKLAKDNRLPIDREERTKNRTLPTPKVLNQLLTKLPDAYRLAEVVGKWVWVQFKETPAAEIRQQLSQLGFHWNRQRQAWQHPCGQTSLSSIADPHEKYTSYFAADIRPT